MTKILEDKMRGENIKKIEFLGVVISSAISIFMINICKISSLDVWPVLLGAINESAWEKIKVFTIYFLIWGAIEFCLIKIPAKRFIVAKVAGVYLFIFLFILEFAFKSLGNIAFDGLIDTILWIIWYAVSFYVSYIILISDIYIDDLFIFSLLMLILYFSMYLSFTINPPHISLFKDDSLQIYGIPLYKMR